ncbi:MAG: metallophosphoesterase [Bacteroidota bacterium]
MKVKALLILFLLASSVSTQAQEFTLPVFPDTQVEVDVHMDMLDSQIDWIVSNKKTAVIPFVLGVGDIVNYNNNIHWDRASQAFERLDNSFIPYALANGNHDGGAVGEFTGSAAPGNTKINVRQTEKYNRYFPSSRYRNLRGVFEKDKNENSFYTFRAAELNWLVVNLEFCPRKSAVLWADSVVKQHPYYNTIVITHNYLTSDGKICQNNQGYGATTSQEVYDLFVKKNKNILMVLSGHVCSSASLVSTGDNGNKIYQILQDYQCEDAGGGYLRLLKIDPKKGTISAKMYSPFYKKFRTDNSSMEFTGVQFIKDYN